jgi:hypothetical protein
MSRLAVREFLVGFAGLFLGIVGYYGTAYPCLPTHLGGCIGRMDTHLIGRRPWPQPKDRPPCINAILTDEGPEQFPPVLWPDI